MRIFLGLLHGTARTTDTNWLICLGFIVLFLVLLGVSQLRSKLRQRSFRQTMQDLNFQPLQNVIITNPTSWKLFNKGGAGTAENIYYQSVGDTSVTVFDYTYHTGVGRGRSDYRHTPVLLHPNAERIHLARFFLQPRGLFGKIAGNMQGMVSQGSDADWLQRHYAVETAENASLPGLQPTGLGAVPLAKFLREHSGLTVESDGVMLLVYRENAQERAGILPQVINEAMELLEAATGCRVGRVTTAGQ